MKFNNILWEESTFIIVINPYSAYALIDQNPIWIAQATFFDQFQTDDFKMDMTKMGDPGYSWVIDNMEEYMRNQPDLTSVFNFSTPQNRLSQLSLLQHKAELMDNLRPGEKVAKVHTSVHIPVLRRVK